jgi:hypothetical protein
VVFLQVPLLLCVGLPALGMKEFVHFAVQINESDEIKLNLIKKMDQAMNKGKS